VRKTTKKTRYFQPISRYISDTTEDRHIVTTED